MLNSPVTYVLEVLENTLNNYTVGIVIVFTHGPWLWNTDSQYSILQKLIERGRN